VHYHKGKRGGVPVEAVASELEATASLGWEGSQESAGVSRPVLHRSDLYEGSGGQGLA